MRLKEIDQSLEWITFVLEDLPEEFISLWPCCFPCPLFTVLMQKMRWGSNFSHLSSLLSPSPLLLTLQGLPAHKCGLLFSAVTLQIHSFICVLKKYCIRFRSVKFSSVQSLSNVRLFVTPWIAAHQASLTINNSQSPPKPMYIKLVMPSSHLILCHPLFLLPPIPPSIRVFSNELTLRMRWPKFGVSASTSVLPMNTQDWSPLGWTGWISLQSKGLSRVISSTTVQKHQFVSSQLSSQSNSHIHTWPLGKP